MVSRVLREAWAVDITVRVQALRAVVARAKADAGVLAAHGPLIESIDVLLGQATEASTVGHLQRSLADRWSGGRVALAYQSVHEAEIEMVALMTGDEVDASVPTVVARALAVLDPADPRRVAIDGLPKLAAQRPHPPGVRAVMQEAMRIGFDAVDQMHVRVRSFRNLILYVSAVVMVFMTVVVVVAAIYPTAMPTCFRPGPQAACPSGADHPTGADVPVLAGLGLLGGALAAAFSIRKVSGTSAAYDIPVALAVLKPPLGALTAVAAILLLGGRFVPGFSELDSQEQILAYALVFGYAQQLITRLIDNQAQTILNELPGKDSAATHPTPRPGDQ